MTHVINMFGGSGLGKSTAAAHLYSEMKLRKMKVELVREFVKNWAWEGVQVGPYDQPYIFGQQSRSESILYGKVDYIVSDSPILFGPIYEKHYTGDSIVEDAVFKFIKLAEDNGVVYHNFLLKRNKKFDPKGRFEDEKTARLIDKKIENYLIDNNIDYTVLDCSDRDRTEQILRALGK